MKRMLLLCLIVAASVGSFAQKGINVLKSDAPITWLGMDFTQARYIGSAAQFKDIGEVTDDQMRDKYIPAWNALFINEQKKYDVADYIGRASVSYALKVTEKANNAIRGGIFSQDPGDYGRLTEEDIGRIVRQYDFMGRTGTGMIFFIEGMSKGKEEVAAWVAFVDMDHKTVLQAKRITGHASGFGFRNYWAKGFLNILKDVKSGMRRS